MKHLFFNNNNTVDDASVEYTNPGQVPSEQIAILDADAGTNLDLTGANASDRMIIVQGNDDGQAMRSHVIEKDKIEAVISQNYTAPVKQQTHVGYDGTDGTIVNGEGTYEVKVVDVTNGYLPNETMRMEMSADSGDTEYQIAKALAKAAADNPRFFVDVDVLVDESTTQLVDTTAGSNVTLRTQKGSSIVVATVTSGEVPDASEGDYIRIGHATDTSYPVYEIENIESNDGSETEIEITLDREYAGDSATGVAAGSTSTAPADGDAAGLQITGDTPKPSNLEGIEKEKVSEVTSFRTALSEDFGDTEIQATATPKSGSGSYEQIADLERNTQGGQSFYHRATPFQAEKPEFFADSSTDYDMVTVRVRTNTTPNIAKSNKYVDYILAWDTGASIGTQLETFFGV